MKNLFFIAIAAWVCGSSCTKKNDTNQLSQPSHAFQQNPKKNQGTPLKKDEVKHIVILKPVRPNGMALASLITFINGLDTLFGQTTANNTECEFDLREDGDWGISIASQGYVTINETRYYTDSFTYQVDTLQLQQ